MAKESKWSIIKRIDLNQLNILTEIPYLLVIFLFVIFGLHIIAALINGANITEFGPLRLPMLVLVTVLLMVLVLTIVQRFSLESVQLVLGNWSILIGLAIILAFVIWLSSPEQGLRLIPTIFSAVGP